MVSCEVVTGTSWTLIVGSYLLPSTFSHLPDLEESLARFQVQYPIVLVDLNVNMDEAQNPRSRLVSNLLTEFVLIDFMHHFRQLLRFHNLKMWT